MISSRRISVRVSSGGREEFFPYRFPNFVTNGQKSIIVSSRILTSFKKSCLLKGPPRSEVLRSANIF